MILVLCKDRHIEAESIRILGRRTLPSDVWELWLWILPRFESYWLYRLILQPECIALMALTLFPCPLWLIYIPLFFRSIFSSSSFHSF